MDLQRKGQGNSFWIIVAAVLALIVMVVLLLIFSSQATEVSSGISGCEGKGGQCVEGSSCPDGTLVAPFDCPVSAPRCCLGLTQAGE